MEHSAHVVFVLVDGMRDDTARIHMGYLEGLVEQKLALRARARSILPSLSRPCYEAIMTGSWPTENGIVSNVTVRRSGMTSVFDVVRHAGKSSAVAAYHWMSELYHRAPFHLIEDIEQTDNAESYTHGRFYYRDSFPDAHVFSQAERLRVVHRPDLTVIHPMGVDDAGHKFGSGSKEYDDAVSTIDMILALCMPQWLEDGCTVIVTADHGMNPNGLHGGTEPGVRTVPLYIAGNQVKLFGIRDDMIDQTTLANLVCRLLGLAPAATMHAFSAALYDSWFQK
jgi:predicted AlkP superfamily pyrophosphatase or phosphodiesterase